MARRMQSNTHACHSAPAIFYGPTVMRWIFGFFQTGSYAGKAPCRNILASYATGERAEPVWTVSFISYMFLTCAHKLEYANNIHLNYVSHRGSTCTPCMHTTHLSTTTLTCMLHIPETRTHIQHNYFKCSNLLYIAVCTHFPATSVLQHSTYFP